MIANWVMRLLKTNTLEEYRILRLIIINELKLIYPNLLFKFGLEYIKNVTVKNDKLDKLLQMLDVHGIPIDDDFKKQKWARWLRYGCPTTTNSLESLHSHINANIPIKGTFFDKLLNVQKCIKTRFDNYHNCFERNFDEYIIKIKNNASITQRKMCECNCGEYLFYCSLYNNLKTPCRHTINDYISRNNVYIIPHYIHNVDNIQCKIEYEEILDKFPEKLKKDDITHFNMNFKTNPYDETLFYESENEIKTKISWNIIYSIKHMINKSEWKKKKENIISYVIVYGNNINLNLPEEIARWRIESYNFANLNLIN